MTSPIAQIWSCEVWSLSLTTIAPFSLTSTPAFLSSSPSMFGILPVASSTPSAWSWICDSPVWISKVKKVSKSDFFSSFPSMILLVLRILIPLDSKFCLMRSTISGSSFGKISVYLLISVTWAPRSAYIEANSSPIYPAPIITSLSGSFDKFISSALV